MAQSLVYRTLTREDISQMHRSFLEAFLSYKVNMKMSREAFEDRMLSKLNMRFDLSPGVFSGDKLIAFIFQAINSYEGNTAAYNGGTGVIPGHTGQGLTAKMYDFILPQLKETGVQKCVLEVLTDNEVAIKAYEAAGFEKTKTFQCLMLKEGVLKSAIKELDGIRQVEHFDSREYLSIAEFHPSMLDQLSQLKYHLGMEQVLEYRLKGKLLGYIIFQPVNGRIAQVAVRRDHQRQGIGSALMYAAHNSCQRKTLSVLNIEMKRTGLIEFFVRLGFVPDLTQFEMQKYL